MNYLNLFKSLMIIYLMLGVLLYLMQRSMIYHPTTQLAHNFKTLKLPNQDIIVEALVTHEQSPHAIMYFGGNAEQVVYTAGDFFQEFPGHATYLMKYRGYAGADGSASEAALYADALALYDQIKQQHDQVKIIGRSLGSGIATYLASQRPVDQLILVTPFDSLRNVAQSMMPVYPMNWLLKDHYDSLGRMNQISSPVMILMASQDQVIRPKHTKNLAKVLPANQLQFNTIQAGHNDLDLSPKYFPTIRTFLTKD